MKAAEFPIIRGYMESSTVQISDLIIAHPEVSSFKELEELVRRAARAGAINLSFDVKPDFQDTPRAWQDRLEAVFTSVVPEIR
jgi:hypothetical protein